MRLRAKARIPLASLCARHTKVSLALGRHLFYFCNAEEGHCSIGHQKKPWHVVFVGTFFGGEWSRWWFRFLFLPLLGKDSHVDKYFFRVETTNKSFNIFNLFIESIGLADETRKRLMEMWCVVSAR